VSSAGPTRRSLLAASALASLFGCASPPPSPWRSLTPDEAALLAALADRLIPPDPEFPGAGEAGAAAFIDGALASPWGVSADDYRAPPFAPGLPGQGWQSPFTPREIYREGLARLTRHCRLAYAGRRFEELPPALQDEVLGRLERGAPPFGPFERLFFERLREDVITSYFADPLYGGNRGMAGWRLIGFPGARYDYRAWVARHGEAVDVPYAALPSPREV
jgi:gluconate 2-dehydrogenase gamma chain